MAAVRKKKHRAGYRIRQKLDRDSLFFLTGHHSNIYGVMSRCDFCVCDLHHCFFFPLVCAAWHQYSRSLVLAGPKAALRVCFAATSTPVEGRGEVALGVVEALLSAL